VVDLVPNFAVSVAAVFAVTGSVVIVNVADVANAGIITEAGVDAVLTLLVSFTVSPPVGAIDELVTVPIALFPPMTLEGLTDKLARVGALMVSVLETDFEPIMALIVTVAFTGTGIVLTGNDALVFPAATVTDDSTVAEELDEESVRTAPLLPAFAERVTVAVEDVPPTTDAGDNDNLLTD